MKDDQLINKKYHILQKHRIFNDSEKFIYNIIAENINESIDTINFKINKCLEIGLSSSYTYNYIKKRFGDLYYLTADISEQTSFYTQENSHIKLDHDKWNLQKDQYDLIISNFYLHLSNNFDLLIKNINKSLKKNGFFIASLPGKNLFFQIKECMIYADIEVYGGSHLRFPNFLTVENVNQILKKHNYKIPVIEVETIELRYSKFSNLLKDIRNIGNSNIYNDRKRTFEFKNYFKIVEEIYWKKFSKNNKLNLQLEIMYISGWKEDESQQKPLKPGEAKNSLKDFM